MKRNIRRQILLFLFVAGVLLKKCGFGLGIFLTLPAVLLLTVELIRSALSKNHNKYLQTAIYIVFSSFLIISLAQLQYWIPNLHYSREIWIAWCVFSIIFFWKGATGNTQITLWFIISFLLTTASFMNPRTYHNFYRASYYEDYILHHYTEVEIGIAEMYIDRYKKPQEVVAKELFKRAIEAQVAKDYDLALELFNAAIDKYPDDAQMYFDRGYFRLTKLELSSDIALSSVKDFDRAIKLRSDYADAYVARGLALSYLGRHLRACYDYQLAKALNPKLNVYEGWKKNCERAFFN